MSLIAGLCLLPCQKAKAPIPLIVFYICAGGLAVVGGYKVWMSSCNQPKWYCVKYKPELNAPTPPWCQILKSKTDAELNDLDVLGGPYKSGGLCEAAAVNLHAARPSVPAPPPPDEDEPLLVFNIETAASSIGPWTFAESVTNTLFAFEWSKFTPTEDMGTERYWRVR